MIRTELEYCTLGVIWRRGPCSAYAVRCEFERSASSDWSASAGAIYPVVERLIGAGLILARPKDDGRNSRELSVTAPGLAALRRWISRMDEATTATTQDPVRTRLLFLEALDPADRDAAIEVAMTQTRQRIGELKRLHRELLRRGDEMEALVTLGGGHQLEGRLRWLKAVRSRFSGAARSADS